MVSFWLAQAMLLGFSYAIGRQEDSAQYEGRKADFIGWLMVRIKWAEAVVCWFALWAVT